MHKFYKMFVDENPAALDQNIDKFIADGRKLVEKRMTLHVKEVQAQAIPSIPGFKMPPGAIQVSYQMINFCLLVYQGNAKDLAASKPQPIID